MKLSLSTFVYFRYPLIDAIIRMADFGYDAVEIWGGRPHAYYEDMDSKRIAELKKVITDQGMEISNFIPAQFRYPVNIAAPDKQIRENSVIYIKKNIDAAAELGSPYVSLCPGFSMYGQSIFDAWQCMIESMQATIDHAKKTPVKLILEPGNLYETDLVVTINDGLKAVAELNDQIGLLPDTGHLFINKESLSDVVEKCQGKMVHYHIDDNMGLSDDHMVPGDGKIYYDVFLSKLKHSGYQGSLAVEIGFQYTPDPDPAVKRSIDFIRNKEKEI